MSPSTVSLSLDDYNKLLSDVRDANAKEIAATRALADYKALATTSHPSYDKSLAQLAINAIKIVQFAVGGMAPEQYKAWPTGALRHVAIGIGSGIVPMVDRELELAFVQFADDADQIDGKRPTPTNLK